MSTSVTIQTAGYLISQEAIDNINNGYLDLSRAKGNTFYFVETTYDQAILQKIFDAINSRDIDALLNLYMLTARPPEIKSEEESGKTSDEKPKEYRLLQSIEKDADGIFKPMYETNTAQTITKSKFDDSFTKSKAYIGLSPSFLVSAIMFEKISILGITMAIYVEELRKINEKIAENNKAIKTLSKLSDGFHECAMKKDATGTFVTYNIADGCMTPAELQTYLIKDVQCGGFGTDPSDKKPYFGVVPPQNKYGFCFWYGVYNTEGGDGGNRQNIDVVEQSALTEIANLQDAARRYGDELNSAASLLQTKISDLTQRANTCISSSSSVIKATGDTNRGLVANVR
jgi:hypothetical protein